jgi:hypothetical protein
MHTWLGEILSRHIGGGEVAVVALVVAIVGVVQIVKILRSKGGPLGR